MNSYLTEDAQLIRSALPTGTSPPEDSENLFLLYAVLMRAKGPAVTPSDVHDAWAAWMHMTEGHHDALVPYVDLDPETRAEDLPYVEAIRRAAGLRSGQTDSSQ
jgi:hypothetical protein